MSLTLMQIVSETIIHIHAKPLLSVSILSAVLLPLYSIVPSLIVGSNNRQMRVLNFYYNLLY